MFLASCSQSDIIKNDIQRKLGDSVYYTTDTSIGNPISFCFSDCHYVSDYVVFNYENEKIIIVCFKGNYIAYCRIFNNRYNQFTIQVYNRYFDLIDNTGKKVTYRP